jgi:hypothetical protein
MYPVKSTIVLLSLILITSTCSSVEDTEFSPRPAINQVSPTSTLEAIVTPTTEKPTGTQIIEIPEITPVPPDHVISDTKITDVEGKVSFNDPYIGQEVTVSILSVKTGQPIKSISVNFHTNGPSLLIVAFDQEGRFLPNVTEIQYNDIAINRKTTFGKSNQASTASQVGGIAVALLLMEVLDGYEAAKAWVEFYQNPPQLEKWSLFSRDYCVTPEQMNSGIRAVVGTGLIILPGPADLINHIPNLAPLDDWAWLSAMSELTGSITTSEGLDKLKALLESNNGVVRWKVVELAGLNKQIAFPIGWCLNPLDQSDINSVLERAVYSFENNEPSLLNPMISSVGVGFAPYATSYASPDYNNLLEVITLVESSQMNSAPQCIGIYRDQYEPKASVYLQNIILNWSFVGVRDRNGSRISVGINDFGDGKYYIAFMAPIEDNYPLEYLSINSQCP